MSNKKSDFSTLNSNVQKIAKRNRDVTTLYGKRYDEILQKGERKKSTYDQQNLDSLNNETNRTPWSSTSPNSTFQYA